MGWPQSSSQITVGGANLQSVNTPDREVAPKTQIQSAMVSVLSLFSTVTLMAAQLGLLSRGQSKSPTSATISHSKVSHQRCRVSNHGFLALVESAIDIHLLSCWA